MFPQLILRSVGLWKNQFCALGNSGSVRMSKLLGRGEKSSYCQEKTPVENGRG
jgi:hypothetical protein